MMGFTITIQDRATPVLQAIAIEMNQEKIKPIVGRAAVNLFQSHFYDLERERSGKKSFGAAGSHFYAKAARGTQFDETSYGVKLSVNHIGIRQRFKGGDIKPGPGKKMLTIPASAEAYNHRAREFSNLDVGRAADERGRMRPALVDVGSGKPYYWLVPEAHQNPDPSVVPTEQRTRDTVIQNVRDYFERIVARGGRA